MFSNIAQERVIFRVKPSSRSTIENAGFEPFESASGKRMIDGEPILESAQLTSKEVADIKKDQNVIGVATSMPLSLINPTSISEPTILAKGNTWGVEAVGSHRSAFSGDNVVIAVLDTGINTDHIAFAGVELVRRNFTTGPDEDQNGHGTHCAGTIFGRDVNGLRIGVAKGVRKALIGKILGPGGGSSDKLANAIYWAYENGANVISMSLGIDFPGFVNQMIAKGLPAQAATSIALHEYQANVNLFSSLTRYLEQSSLFSQPAVIIAASGNDSNRPNYNIAVSPPGAADDIISVGALQQAPDGKYSVAKFSNSLCKLSGPGVGITSAWIGSSQALKTIDGTSMATPHVAGCAALWAEKQRQLTGVLTRDFVPKLLASAQFITGASYEDIGNGMVQAPQH